MDEGPVFWPLPPKEVAGARDLNMSLAQVLDALLPNSPQADRVRLAFRALALKRPVASGRIKSPTLDPDPTRPLGHLGIHVIKDVLDERRILLGDSF